MINNNANWDIAFYGQDFSSIDNAFIAVQSNGKTEVDNVKGNEYYKNLLWNLLKDLNKYRDELCIGHSDNPESKEEDYKLWSANSYRSIKNDADGKKVDSSEWRFFGSLVGTVRKEYSKNDFKKLYSINEDNIKIDSPDDSLLKPFTSKKTVKIKLVIYSRFDSLNRKNLEQTKPYFIANLLMSGKLRFSKMTVDFDYESLFDFYMLWVLVQRFRDASLKGFFKKYQRFERNDNKLKGSIDIARHIRLNMGMDNGKVAYSFRENSLDNMLNHLLLEAFEYIKSKYPDIVDSVLSFDLDFERELQVLKYEIGYPKYNRRAIIAGNNTPISHPFYYEYKELQKTCLMILRDEGVSPFGNISEHVDGILYYVPDLWEDYLESHIRKGMRKYRDSEDSQYDMELSAQEKIYVMTDMKWEGGKLTKPDYVFRYSADDESGESRFFILDAKYRPQWGAALNGLFHKDLVDDYNKCLRDMVSVLGSSSGVIFPIYDNDEEDTVKTDSEKQQYAHRYSKYNPYGVFYTFPVMIKKPEENDSFKDWRKKMDDEVAGVMDKLMPVLDFELERKIELDRAISIINEDYDIDGLIEKIQ